MKIIFDNIIFSLQTSGGISVYWYELLRRFLNDKNNNKSDTQIYQFMDVEQNIFANKLRQECSWETIQESKLPVKLLRYLDFRNISFSKLLFKDKKKSHFIFHSSYYRSAPGAINIVTIYDFTYAYYRSGLARLIHVWQQARAINNASGIICISENTKQDLLKFYPHIDVPIEVIHMGKSEDFLVLDKKYVFAAELQFLVAKTFCMFIGDRKNYKNFFYMLEQIPTAQFLVIVGGGELDEQEKGLLEKYLGGNYYHFFRPDIALLNELYNLAFCLIYPSDYEGFGIPVIEAMAAGCPVICQPVSSLGEVADDCGIYFDKEIIGDCSGSLQNAIKQLQDKDFYHRTVTQGIANAKRFSWDKCYQQTIDFYASFLEDC
ncbi:MAG: glycosyltransferase family 1 protein [Pseudomonadota bacterium]